MSNLKFRLLDFPIIFPSSLRFQSLDLILNLGIYTQLEKSSRKFLIQLDEKSSTMKSHIFNFQINELFPLELVMLN